MDNMENEIIQNMQKEISEKKRNLINIIQAMAINETNEATILLWYEELKNLFNDNYRHDYSIIYQVIFNYDNVQLNFISDNISILRNYIELENRLDNNVHIVNNNILRLCDHINLEIKRKYSYDKTNNQLNDLEKRINNETIKLNTLNADYEKINTDLEKADDRFSKIQNDTLTTLSIFSAIVITFFGGFSVLANAFSEINNADIIKLILITCLIGFILFNTIYGLMYMIGKLTTRTIHSSCKTDDCSCGRKCGLVKRLRNRFPYIYWVNVILLGIAGITILFYFLNSNVFPYFANIFAFPYSE